MNTRWIRLLLGVSRAEEVRRARAEEGRDRADLHAHLDAAERAFDAEMGRRARAAHVALGDCPPGPPYRIALPALDGTHAWWSAGTGAGKTRGVGAFVAGVLHALLLGEPIAVVCVGMQGDLVDLVLRALASLLRGAPAGRRRDVLGRLLVVRFFRGATLPPMNLLARSPHAPPLSQAQALAEVVEHALGAPLGSRQQVAATMLFALAVEAGLSVNALRLLLGAPPALLRLAGSASEPLVRAYFEQRFPKEAAATTDGIASRLDRLLSLDASLRGALAGPEAIDYAACFRPGAVSCFDFSGSPLGGDDARRALGALTIHSLVAAALSSARRADGHALLVIDEAQLALTPATAQTLATAVTTIRAAKVGIHFVNQSLAQLDRGFVQLLATNVTWRMLGRSGAADAQLCTEFLPRTGRVPKPRAPFAPAGERAEFLSRGEEEAHWVAECGRLPRRTFLVTERSAPFGVRRIVTPAFDPPAWGDIPAGLRAEVERGATGVPRDELVARARRAEEAALATAGERPAEEGEAPGRRPRAARAPVTPDAISRAEGWSRRGRRTP